MIRAETQVDLTRVDDGLLYDHTYEINSQNNTATFEAFVYKGNSDVKTQFSPDQFTWYLKTEDGTEYKGTGYTKTFSIDECGYGAEVIGKFAITDDTELLDSEDNNLTDPDDTPYTVRADGDHVRISDLEVATTVFGTDKILISGAEDEHLVTINTLQEYLNTHLDKQVLFNTTAGWNAQAALVSQADTLYIYTDYQRDSSNNPVAGIKVGDGNAYLIDLPFTDAIAMEHIADNTRHITSAEREFWNDKVSCYYAGTEQLVFTTA